MPKINGYTIPNEIKKPIETVYEIRGDEYRVPSFEEFMKSYENDGKVNYDDLSSDSVGEVKGYGPCRNTICGCSCSSDYCVCRSSDDSIHESGDGVKTGNVTFSGRKGWDDSFEGEARFSLISRSNWNWNRNDNENKEDIRIGSVMAGGKIARTGVDAKAGIDLVNYKSNGFQARAGLNVDTAAKIDEDGAKLKLLGFGISIGKKMEVSTPLGGVSKDTDCVIQ